MVATIPLNVVPIGCRLRIATNLRQQQQPLQG